MLPLTALALLQPQQEVRLLDLRGMLMTMGEVRITRTLHLDGSVEWQEETKWDDGRRWLETRVLGEQGRLASWSVEWKSAPKEKGANDASWKAELTGSGYRIVKTKYRGEEMSVSRSQRLDPVAFDFKHLSLREGATPLLGEAAKSLLFIPGIADAGELHQTEVLFGGQVEVSVKSQKILAHKITLKAEPRNETWWLDASGLPIKREFWTKDPSSPHRSEILRRN